MIEIITPEVKINECFGIKLKLGNTFGFESAKLTINAQNFTIISPDSSISDGEYSYEYWDFDDDKYRAQNVNGEVVFNYSENFYFFYTGSSDNCEGKIKFQITGIKDDTFLHIKFANYRVKGENIEIYMENNSKEQPKTFCDYISDLIDKLKILIYGERIDLYSE